MAKFPIKQVAIISLIWGLAVALIPFGFPYTFPAIIIGGVFGGLFAIERYTY